MQTIYAFSYNPAIATGTNTTGTNWRMAYQQPIMLYKGTSNTIKIVVFNNNTHVVDLTNYSLKLQIVDKETQEYYITRTASVTTPTSGVASVTFTESDLRNLNNRFYHVIAKLVDLEDGSSIVSEEILYLDDNYGAFTPVVIENAWNYNPTELSTEDGVQVINFRNIGETPDSYIGQAGKLIGVNSAENAVEFTTSTPLFTIGNISIANQTIGTDLDTITLHVKTQTIEFKDNSTDPAHLQGDGGFLTFFDATHTNDGPRFEIWYGSVGPTDPIGQHSLDIRVPDDLSYVEFASWDLKSFMGIDSISPFIQTNWDQYPDRYWRFLPDGELRLPFDGSKITSHGGQIQLGLNFSDFRISLNDGTKFNTTIFDTVGTVYFGGDVLPGEFEPDVTPIKSLGSSTHSWKDLYVANLSLSNSTITTAGNLNIQGNLLPVSDNTYDLGSPANQWRHLFVANGSVYIDNIKLTNTNGKLAITKVVNPGEENEEPDPEDSDASSNITKSLVNGEHEFKLESDGTLTLDGDPFTGSGGGTITVGNGVGTSIENVTEILFNGTITEIEPGLVGVSIAGGANQPYLELTNDPFIWTPYAGEVISFTKEDYATGAEATDEIDTGLALKRLNNQGLFNPYLEPDWDNTTNDSPSPTGTLWNKDGWTDLTNLNQRIYYSFYDTFLRFGQNVVAAEAVMFDVANDKYYKVDFTIWGNANQGAPVSYTRTQLDPVTGDPIGDPVEFVKAGYADPTLVNDPIDTGVTLTRGNQQSIYNIAQETSYNTQGDPQDSPEGTVWNADGWDDFKEVRNRSYGTFQETLNYAIGENILNKELVMHDTINDKYWAFKFSSWTQNNEGGGFSYTRQLINTSNLFIKPDYDTDTVDVFVEDDGDGAGIGITRDEQYGIYNPYREEGWNSNVSPNGTLWNIEGWDDLSDIETRTYQTFYAAFGNGGLGNKVPGTKTVMYIPDTDKYYAIQWLSWTQNGNGGGFSYLRYELDLTKINEGVKFADGTVLKSAAGVGRVKSRASGNRRIEEVVGSKTVSVTAVATTNYTFSYYADTTSSQIQTARNPESEAILIPIYNGTTPYTRLEISTDGGSTWGLAYFSGYGPSAFYFYFNNNRSVVQSTEQTFILRVSTGGAPQVWWDKADLSGGSSDFRGAVIDYHAYSGEATWIGTIHIVQDNGNEHITHTEVNSGSTDAENDDLWFVQNEGTISYRRIDGEAKTLKVHWTAKVFYGSEYYD